MPSLAQPEDISPPQDSSEEDEDNEETRRVNRE